MAFVDVNKRKEGISFVYVILYVSRCMTACLIALEQDPAACVLTLRCVGVTFFIGNVTGSW